MTMKNEEIRTESNAVQTVSSVKTEFLELIASEVDRGIYVWGGDGETVSAMDRPEDWIRAHETSKQNGERSVALYRKRVQAGVSPIRAFDCSGFIYWAMKSVGVQKSDVNSRGLYKLCSFRSETNHGNMNADDLKPADLVFRHNGTEIVHVGVYVGNGKVIEAKGRDVGVVQTTLTKGGWNRYGRPDQFPADVSPDAPDAVVRVLGGSVNVRSGDSTAYPVLGIVHRNDRLPYLGPAPSGWHRILYRGQEACITNKGKYTEVLHA